MAKVGVNNAPLHERLVFGYDGSDYQVVKVDTDGNLVAAVKTGQALQANQHSYVGGAWQKAPMPFGYSDRLVDYAANTNLSAGYNTVPLLTVPAGEIWVVTNLACYYVGTVATVILAMALNTGAGQYTIFQQSPPVNYQVYDRQGWWTLKAGDKVQLQVSNATAGDDAYIFAIGFKVDVDL